MDIVRFGIADLNERVLSDNDFYGTCTRERINVIRSDTRYCFFFQALGQRYINLSTRLTGPILHFAMFHELCHAMLHKNDMVHFQGLRKTCPKEKEADVIATLALLPQSQFNWHEMRERLAWAKSHFGNRSRQLRYMENLYKKRISIFFKYGL